MGEALKWAWQTETVSYFTLPPPILLHHTYNRYQTFDFLPVAIWELNDHVLVAVSRAMLFFICSQSHLLLYFHRTTRAYVHIHWCKFEI